MASGSPNASRRRRQACGEEVRGRRVGYNPSIRSLMTTRGWPTPRSCNETGTDSSGLPGTSCRLLPGQGHHHDRTSAHQPSPGRAADLRRVRDGLGTAQERTRPRGRSGQGGAEPTAPSSRNGAVAKSSPAPNRAAAAHPGSRRSTGLEHSTLSAVAAHAEGAAEPADCHRRDGRVHLDHGRPLRATGPLQ